MIPADTAQLPTAADTTQRPIGDESRFVPGRVYFVSFVDWFYIAIAAAVVALAVAPAYQFDSPWVGCGVALTVVLLLHLTLCSRTVPWIPGLAAVMATVQWVLAPWASYHLPPAFPIYRMAVAAPDYFDFAVPATLAFTAGLYLPLWTLGQRQIRHLVPRVPVDFVRTCDIMIVIGLLGEWALTRPLPLVLQYPMVLVGYLGFVAAFGLLIVRATGWGWRLLIVLGARAVLASADGVFHDLLLWMTYSAVLVIFIHRLRGRYFAAAIGGAILIVGVLQSVKVGYRLELEENPDVALHDRASVLATVVGQRLEHPASAFENDEIQALVLRLNQGSIISHSLIWMPAREPFARGETLLAAVRNVAVPRAFDPDKYTAGGYAYFRRFTGLPLSHVSMNLSLAGEMYANFGRTGGILATGLFALMLGLIYLEFARWAQDSPLWWAWAPYVLLYAVQAENGIGEVVNHIAKSALVMAFIVSIVPAWQTLRWWRLAKLARRLGLNVGDRQPEPHSRSLAGPIDRRPRP